MPEEQEKKKHGMLFDGIVAGRDMQMTEQNGE
jgi:hypothetical protein